MFRIFRELSWYFKKQWPKYLLVGLFTLLFTYAITLSPAYIGEIVDQITEATLNENRAKEIFLIMVGIAFLIYFSAVIKRRLLGGLFHKLFYQLKIKFLVNVFKQDGDFFEEYYSGDLITRATGDTNMVARVSTYMMFNLIDTIAMLIIAFLSMMKLSLPMTIYAIIPLPIIFFIVMYLRPKIMRNWKLVRSQVSHLNNLVMESVTHAKLVRGFVMEEEDQQKLASNAENVYQTERKSVLMQSVFMPSFRMVTLISQGIALAYGAYLIMNQKNFTVGNLVTFNLYLGMFASPLFRLGNQITVMSQSGISFERINEILDATPTIQDAADAIFLETVEKIEYQDLSFKYPNDNDYIIKDINLTLLKGQTLGVVGKTGSGKTTLLRQLLRMYVINEGNIYFNDLPVEAYQKESIRARVAYVPQEHVLFSRTVLENLAVGEGEDTVLSIPDSITMADFWKDISFLTDGLETIVGESGVTLSGGQKQRLSIARAFLKNADILIMDDSLSAVDGVTEANILRNLKEFRENKTNIIASHRLSVVEHANEIIVLDQGRIVERGTHQELMDNMKWYYQQYIIQQMEDNDEKK